MDGPMPLLIQQGGGFYGKKLNKKDASIYLQEGRLKAESRSIFVKRVPRILLRTKR